jgi:CBS domain containing-hemolysin-like protein
LTSHAAYAYAHTDASWEGPQIAISSLQTDGQLLLSPYWALALVAGLIAANGLFVAAEFALIAVRRGNLEALAERGNRRAKAAVAELDRASLMLSGVQFGITATSLVVGFLAEAAVGDALVRPVLSLFSLPEATAAPISLTLAFLISTVVQMLFGELAPKNLALAIPERMSLWVAFPIRWFGKAFGPIIRIFDSSAAWVTRRVFRVDASEERHVGHSPEELTRIIIASREQGQFSLDQGELLTRAVELAERRVHEVMVPRTRVAFLDGDDTLDTLRIASRETGHSRFPVVGVSDDDILGTVHIKDLLSVETYERGTTLLRSIVSPALVIPETDRLRPLLAKMRQARRTLAIVADEYGGVAGIVTLEDVVEELVGEIEDEFDTATETIVSTPTGGFVFDGTVRTDEASQVLGTELPEGEYDTIVGLLMSVLERIPAEGEFAEIAGWRLTATEVEGMRVAKVTAEPLERRT